MQCTIFELHILQSFLAIITRLTFIKNQMKRITRREVWASIKSLWGVKRQNYGT